MKTIAILGARGRLGNMVARAFLARNWRVIAVTRDGKPPRGLEDTETRAADAMDPDSLTAACRGADVIFNGLNPVYTDWQRMAVPMADNVIAAARATGALHLFPGNVYNYGRSIPALADEASPMPGETGKGVIRNTMEARFKAAAESGVRTIVLRAGDFYGGKAAGSWFDLVITARLAKGVFTWPGTAAIEHAWAYLPDLAQAFVKLAETAPSGDRFECYTFAGHTLSGSDMQQLVEAALGKPLKRAGLPWLLLRAGGLVVPMWREIVEMSYLWFTPHRLSGARLEAAVGPLAGTCPADAIAQALGDLGYVTQPKRLAA